MPHYEGDGSYQYKYNGKEYQDELGLNFYDYGARNYDPALGRWMNIDPLAEKYYKNSPYSYGLNSPVYFIDPDGMRIDVTALVKNKMDENDSKNSAWLLIQMMADLSEVSGKTISVHTDQKGNSYLKSSGEGNDSEGAKYVDYLIDNKSFSINVFGTNAGEGSMGFHDDRVFLDAGEINGIQNSLKDNGFDSKAMSVGMAFLHETLHTFSGASFFNSKEDVEKKKYDNGRFRDENYVVKKINVFRKELNLPTRYRYGSIPGTLHFEKDGNKKDFKTKDKAPKK
jgi:RHS repeat-associated protein